MSIKVIGKDEIVKKRNLLSIYPKEYTNRRLIKKFISYVSNNVYEKSVEQDIAGYVGERCESDAKSSLYVKEPTNSRQISQLIPIVKTKNGDYEEDNTIYNFLAEMNNEGSLVYDQNKLLSNQYLCWCPAINVDMFLNYNNYYWIPTLVEPTDDGDEETIYTPTIRLSGLSEISIDNILNQEQVTLKDIIVKKYNKDAVTLKYNWVANESDFTLKNGMRIIFEDLKDESYNNIPYMIIGCGESIQLQEDKIYDNITNNELNYYTIERGSIDSNVWSMTNKWVHREVLEETNREYLKLLDDYQAQRPILCYNKDIELYNNGTFGRGVVDVITDLDFVDINAKKLSSISGHTVYDGMKILLLNTDIGENSLFEVKLTTKGYIKLNVINNGQNDSTTSDGDAVLVRYGMNTDGNWIPLPYYYSKEKSSWIIGQKKETSEQHPLFNLYDSEGTLLSTYENSEFNGSKLFDYLDTDDETVSIDKILNRRIKVDSFGNYQYDNCIYSQEWYYTPYKQNRQKIDGYKFYKNLKENSFLNDWHLTTKENIQYIKTQFEIKSDEEIIDNKINLELAYTPDETEYKKSVIVKKNGSVINDGITIQDNIITIEDVEEGDIFDILFYKKDIQSFLIDGYEYEQPLSLKLNQTNENISTIGYNNCLDHMMSIIDNQKNISGSSYGFNNYYTIKHDITLGNKIVQHITPIIKIMILNNMEETNVLNATQYVREQYREFKYKFINLVKSLIQNNSCCYTVEELKENNNLAIEDITDIINKINVGKEGLLPFYNNGVTSYNYIPSTPAYNGLANVYEPRIEEFMDGTTDDNPLVVICHDGSIFKCTNTQLDYYVLKMEQMIYDSITNFSKDKQPIFRKLKYIPGRFRTTSYTLDDYKTIYNQFLERWVVENKIDIEKNPQFDYTPSENPAWKTWNYSNLEMENGETVQGSYRAIYMYYYDTYRPNTHPWEMLGFGDMPSWWEDRYGEYPYASTNEMWVDIENGIIAEGDEQGEYDYLKRKDLVEKYLPVDGNGKLLAPYEIGLVTKPLLGIAVQPWKLGDMGSYEFNYMLSSDYRFNMEMILYLMKPTHWVEMNWDTLNKKLLFKNTDYEQIIDSKTNSRPNDTNIIAHNEYINDSYVRNFGFQQWISDYLTKSNMSIETYLGDRLRYADVNLGYRCAGYYQTDTVRVDTDTYDEIPSDNYSLSIFKSKTNNVSTYSAMVIEKTSKGFILDGFDATNPYFIVKVPEYNNRKNGVDVNNQSFTYYNVWSNEYKQVPYRTVYKKIQDLYTDIIGYGKALEDLGWSFMSLTADGEVLDFNKSGKSFLTWATTSTDDNSNVLMLNPGVLGMRLYHNGMVDDMSLYINGQASLLNLNNEPVKMDNVDIYRQSYVTEIRAKNENFSLIKARIVEYEHLLMLDNKTMYGDVIYEPLFANILNRIKLYGVKSGSWDGTLYAPGYLVANGGAIPNMEKQTNDLQYIFDTGNVKLKGEEDKLSKYTVGFVEKKCERELFENDTSMFDFYKGYIREKGTKAILNKLNRSSRLSSNGESIDLYEKWAFKEGEYGYTSDNSTQEFILDQSKITQNPQVITFETAISNYYDESKQYYYNDIVVYKNHEYKCIVNDSTIGEFNDGEWETTKYIGNYVVYWDDENWIKKQNNIMDNHFRFTDDYKTLPIGGFPMVTDVDYIVATEEEANTLKETMMLGQTVWVVKKDNDDWDVFKKVGENKFISMRYANLKELYNQNAYDKVYEILDNKTKYYVNTDKEYAETNRNTTPIYSDVDLTNKVGVYANLHEPEYAKEIGDYIEGTNYKVKLYNTVFTTTQKTGTITNKTIVTASDDQLYSYSFLNMQFSDTSNQEKKYRCTFNLVVNTHISKCTLNINGTVIDKDTTKGTYKGKSLRQAIFIINALEGDVLDYTVSGNGCTPITGSITIGSKNIRRVVDLHYAEGAILFTTNDAVTDQEIELVYEGDYEIEFMASGGGASSGARWKSHHKGLGISTDIKTKEGNGGGAGAYIKTTISVADNPIEGKTTDNPLKLTTDDLKYMVKSGIGGLGGILTGGTSNPGSAGGAVEFYKQESSTDTKIVYSEGGIGGKSSRDGDSFVQSVPKYTVYGGNIVEQSDKRDWGTGGSVYVSSLFDGACASKIINNGASASGTTGGKQIFNGNTKYGNGGDASNGNGEDGHNGLVVVKFLEYYEKPSEEVDETSEDSDDYVLLGSTNLEYTDVYNKFINEDKPFYCYEAPVRSNERPNAKIINDSSVFYKNRSKSITGTLNNDIIMSLFDVSRNYVVGDLMTWYNVSTNDYTNYICIKDVSGLSIIEGNITEYFEIYKPTLYYKIDTDDYFAWILASSFDLYDNSKDYYKYSLFNYNGENRQATNDIPMGSSEEFILANSSNVIIFETYDNTKTYYANALFNYNDENRQATNDILVGSTEEFILANSEVVNIFEEYNNTKAYNAYTLLTHNNKKYKATYDLDSGITEEAFLANTVELTDTVYTIKRSPKIGTDTSDADMTYYIPDGATDESEITRNEDYVYSFNDRTDPDQITIVLNETSDKNPVLYIFRKNTENEKDNAGTPITIKNNYKLYYDDECSNPVIQQLNREQLTYKDISDDRVIGDSYILVDKIGTLSQLKPQYISEPNWGSISLYGSYSMDSGNITYYTQESSESITSETILHSDYTCSDSSIVYQIGSDDINVWSPKKTYGISDRVKLENDVVDDESSTKGYRSSYYICVKNESKPELEFNETNSWYPFIKNGYIYDYGDESTVISVYEVGAKYSVGDIILNSGEDDSVDKDEYKYWICKIAIESAPSEFNINCWEKASININTRALTYGDITNVVSDKIGTSYKWIDEDITLWTSTKQSETNDDDIKYNQKMYYDEGLTDYAGLFSEFCPQWTTKSYTPNRYGNTYYQVDGKTYDADYNELSLYYSDSDKQFVPLLGNGNVNSDGYYEIYYNNDANGHKNATLSDETKTYINLYRKNGEEYELISNEHIYTKQIEVKTNYYAKSYVNESELTTDNAIDNQTGNFINLYYDKQAEGNNISITKLVSDNGFSEKITFAFNDKDDDYVYNCFFKELCNIELKDDEDADECIETIYNNAESNNEFISRDELYSLWKQYREYIENDIGSNPFNTSSMEHTCESYDYHTLEDGEEKYYNLYKLGGKLYSYSIIHNSGIEYPIVKLFGTESELTTFKHRVFYPWTYDNAEGQLDAYYTLEDLKSVTTSSDVYKYDSDSDEYEKDKSLSIIEINGDSNEIIVKEDNLKYTCTLDTTYKVTTENSIVNTIMYKELGDKFYVYSDSYANRNMIAEDVLSDTNSVGLEEDALMTGKKQWMKVEYVNDEFKFNLLAIQTKRIASSDIKSAYLLDNDTDLTISKVVIFDPIQMNISSDILNEIQYISNIDPVLDYNDLGNVWSEPRVGELWWDISKVRYIDYYQSDIEYRKMYWGKQLPGSEIVINEWTKSVTEPTNVEKYIKKETYNEKTDTFETYYYYWNKNPRTIPELDNRTKSALQISKIINDPTNEGIVWMSPIKCNTNGNRENSFIIANTRDVINGQEAVLQINIDSDNEVQDHTEWALVRENYDEEIPSFMWEKMRDSLLEYKETDDGTLVVPDPTLTGNNRYGISFRPRQTMFKNNYEARRNFIDCVNNIFSSRNNESPSLEIDSSLVKLYDDIPSADNYIDVASTYLEMKNWDDDGYIGENILVESDENHDNKWAIYHMNAMNDFTIVDYQKYDIRDYLEYKDWYSSEILKYIRPKTIVDDITKVDATVLNENDIVRVENDDMWYLYMKQNGVMMKVAQKNMLLNIKSSIYDWMEDDIDNITAYIDYSNTKTLQSYTDYKKGSIIKVNDKYYENNTEENIDSLPNVWEVGVKYKLSSKVLYNGLIYECVANNPTSERFVKSEWKTKWEEVFNLTKYEYKYQEMNILMKNIFDYFD